MTEFNILLEGEKTIKVWVKYDKDAEVLIESVQEGELEKIKNRCLKTEFNEGQMSRNLDSIKFAREIGRAVIKDWKGFTVGKKEFVFDGKNRDLAITNDADFFLFISQTCRNISFLREQQIIIPDQEKLKKNS